MDKLEECKKKLLAILEDEFKDSNESKIMKSLIDVAGDLFIQKGRVANIGEIREWKGKKYIKVAPNKWRPKYDSVSRGAKQSVAIVRKRIQNAQSFEELAQILKENKERFSDENGKPIEIAKEVLKEARKAKKTIKNKESDKTVVDDSSNKARLEGNKIKRNGKTVDKNDPHYKTAVKEAFVEEYKDDINEYKTSKNLKDKNPTNGNFLKRFKAAVEKLKADIKEFSEKIGEEYSFVRKLFSHKKQTKMYDFIDGEEVETFDPDEIYEEALSSFSNEALLEEFSKMSNAEKQKRTVLKLLNKRGLKAA